MGKEATIEAPFTVLIDTREKKPYSFRRMTTGKQLSVRVKTQKAYLETGDYSIAEYENGCCIERKSVSDLVQTVAQHRDRFVRELERLSEIEHSFILVEGEWATVQLWCAQNSMLSPRSLDSSILTWSMRYRPRWIFRPTRATAQKTCWKLFDLYWRKFRNPPCS